jgi:glycosyltransferase involved in cell wall biosynthesis
MSVLHLLGSSGDGGAETYFTSLVTALQQTDVRQAAAIRAHDRRQQRLAAAGVPVTVLPFGGLFDRTTRRRVGAAAKAQGAHVLLAWMNRAARHSPPGDWARIGRLGGYYDLKYYRGFDALVANTTDIRDWIVRQGWPAETALYIPNFAADERASPLLREELHTPEKVPLLLSMGRLHPAKAHDVTLRALTLMPEAWLWIAGSGPLEANLKAMARDLGVHERVRFLGWREDAAALYRTADVCVFPSRFEPLGNVVIQAWAQGTPVVAAASQGPAALIAHGEDGLLFPVDDPQALAREVRRVLEEPGLRYQLIENGRGRVEAEFSEAAVVQQWRELFRSFGDG